MANKYDSNAIIRFLIEQGEIYPDRHDGSYELMREIIASYATLRDYSSINYLDMNAIYLMSIGTWKHSVERKKETIQTSHLPEFEKARLSTLLDEIWRKACNHEYENTGDTDGPQLGMFGTGFYSFKGKTTDQHARDFVHMCVDISTMQDEEEMFDRAEQVLNKDFKGMGSAAASVVLHCLKPTVFPILNNNMGTDNIYEAAGVKIKKRADIGTYIPNCRLIKSFRDKNFEFRNYRVFDIAQWDIEDFILEPHPVGKIDIEKLKHSIEEYKKEFDRVVEEETYKWEAVKCFQDNFKIDAEDFPEMLERALAKEENLLTRSFYFAKGVILMIARHDPEYTRTMFRNLFDESEPVLNRMKQFQDDAEIYHTFSDGKKTFQGPEATSVYLFFQYPDKYYLYLSMKFEYCAKQLGYKDIPKAGSMERVQAYFDMADQIWEYAKTDQELIKMNQSRLTADCYDDPENHVLADDLAFFINWQYRNANNKSEEDEYVGWRPLLDEYDPGLTAEQYQEVFENEQMVRRDWLDTLYYLYLMGGEGTCTQIAGKFGNNPGHYNANGKTVARRVAIATDCSVYITDDGNESFWPVLFVGKSNDGEEGVFAWKLRKPVREAIRKMEEKGMLDSSQSHVDYPKNMILYGPPGTGKTYHTVIYAVAIIEGKEIQNVLSEDYSAVKARYDEYMSMDQIAFTTFHQSYGYEEFIEGIRPQMSEDADAEDGNDVKYVVAKGVFKQFCEYAMTPHATSVEKEEDYGFNRSPAIWKVSLDGTGDNLVRKDCMDNGYIRIGWDGYGENVTDETDFSAYGGKVVLNAFLNRMRIGDVVLSCYSATTIDAIGVITGGHEWHPEFERMCRVRKVKWLAKGLDYNIVDINGGATLTLATVYQLNISLPDVISILQEVNESNGEPEYVPNQDRYVFIIDEINRGNISKIFGELITLIEPSKRIGQAEELNLMLPYSKKVFGVPDNVYIIGTMNTADRSLALMDTALRRRFQFIEMQPDTDILADIEVEGVNISEMLRVMNKRIEILYDKEHTIGHSYFMPLRETPTLECLSEIFRTNIIPLLKEYFFDDYEKIRLVLGDNQKPDDLQFFTRTPVDISSLFGNTDEEIDIDANFIPHPEVINKRPEAYIGIYNS